VSRHNVPHSHRRHLRHDPFATPRAVEWDFIDECAAGDPRYLTVSLMETLLDLNTCLAWKGRLVILKDEEATENTLRGEIVNVGRAFTTPGDVDVAVRLEDGRVRTVLASQQGQTWNFVE
jgi:hypothetical protein